MNMNMAKLRTKRSDLQLPRVSICIYREADQRSMKPEISGKLMILSQKRSNTLPSFFVVRYRWGQLTCVKLPDTPSIQIRLNQVRPANKIHLNILFTEFFPVFLQIYCANMGVEHSLSSYITGASLSNDLSMKKILFLHGFFATGSCPIARALKEAFEGTAVVLTPDLPLQPIL